MRSEPKGECWHKATAIDGVEFTLYNSGHIPGSSQLMIKNGASILYSGDLNLNGGLITQPAETPRCDILIMEATFGVPRYIFPDRADVIREMKNWIEECNLKGRTPVVLGYALGKAQELTKALSSDFTVYVDRDVFEFNRRTERLGVDIGDYQRLEDLSDKDDRIVIAPPYQARHFTGEWYSLALASGWALNPGWLDRYSRCFGFPLSDHSDFNDLIRFVERVSPQVVYTTHGYSREFSSHLRERGFYSEPLSEAQTKLDAF